MSPKCPYRLPHSGSDADQPYEIFEQLRAEAPVVRARLPFGENAWLVTRYQDIVSVLTDPQFGRTPPDFQAPFDVSAVRNFVVAGLSRSLLAQVERRLIAHASRLIANLSDFGFDIVSGYCMPLTAFAFCEVFGTPQKDRTEFLKNSWVLTPLREDRDIDITADEAIAWFRAHIKSLLSTTVSDGQLDILSFFRNQDPSVSDDDMAGFAISMLVAGNDSAANLLSSSIFNLSKTPTLLTALREEQCDVSEIVRELVRFDSPVYPGISRYAQEDTLLLNQPVARGDLIILPIAAAGRDPGVFNSPETCRLGRQNARSLAFGYGQHFCPGYQLAARVVEIGISAFANSTIFETIIPRFEPRWTSLPLRALVRLRLVQ